MNVATFAVCNALDSKESQQCRILGNALMKCDPVNNIHIYLISGVVI